MIKHYFHEKISLFLSFLILNNYFLLSFNSPLFLLKINFLIFFLVVFLFYFLNYKENLNLKFFFLLLIFISLGVPLSEWDPRSTWLFHAKRIFYDNSIFIFADNYAPFSHNDYPKLAPAFASSFASLFGSWNEVYPKISFTLIFLPPLIITYSFIKNTYYIAFLFLVFFFIGPFLINGWLDGLITIYFCLSVFFMYLLIINNYEKYKKNYYLYLLALFFFTSLTLLKNEGTALLTILFFVTVIIELFKHNLKFKLGRLFFLLLSFLPIIMWKYFCYSNGIGYNDYINSESLMNFLPRASELNNYISISYFLLLNEKFLISLALFLLSFFIAKNNKLFIFISFISVIYIFVLFLVFLNTPHDFYFQLNSTASRVIRVLSFLLAFFGLYNLMDYNRKLKNLYNPTL